MDEMQMLYCYDIDVSNDWQNRKECLHNEYDEKNMLYFDSGSADVHFTCKCLCSWKCFHEENQGKVGSETEKEISCEVYISWNWQKGY